MKKIILPIFCLLLFYLLFSLTTKAGAKNQEVKVFIEYPVKQNACSATTNDQINTYNLGGWKANATSNQYKINWSNKPKNLTESQVKETLANAFKTYADLAGISFEYAGSSREAKPVKDRQSSIIWLPLKGNFVAVTYIWIENDRVIDADIVFNRRLQWRATAYTGTNDCGGPLKSYDLANIATHEIGHWMGLGDIYDARAKDLTMYGLASMQELKKTTLGLGDINGVKANRP